MALGRRRRVAPELDSFPHTAILIVEDELLIGLDLEDTLSVAGFTEANICTSCAEAMASLSEKTPSIALLDIQLKDGQCVDVATELERRGVPFIVCSASLKSDVPKIFLRAQWVSKPCVEADLLTAVRNTIYGGSATTQGPAMKN